MLTVGGTITGVWAEDSTVHLNGQNVAYATILPHGTKGTTGTGGAGTYALARSPGDVRASRMNCGGGIGKYTVVTPSGNGLQNVAPTTMGTHFHFFPIIHAFGVDYAKTEPHFLVGAVGSYNSGIWISHDSGSQYSWRDTRYQAPATVHPVVQSPTNFVLAPINAIPLVYTNDGGRTFVQANSWTLSAANGGRQLPLQLAGGWGGTQYAFRNIMVADPNEPSTYYGYNFASCGMISGTVNSGGSGFAVNDTITLTDPPTGSAATVKVTSIGIGGAVTDFTITDMGGGQRATVSRLRQSGTSGGGSGFIADVTMRPCGGFWKSTNGGVDWVQQSNPLTLDALPNYYIINVSQSACLVAVPGHSGHLFYADGSNGAFSKHLYFSPDGGTTIYRAFDRNITEAQLIAVGKGIGSYPSLYLYGKANGDKVSSLYRCDNFNPANPTVGGNWIFLTSYPAGSLDQISGMVGDFDTWGTIYLGMLASGYIFGQVK